jgi:hypothetical protein
VERWNGTLPLSRVRAAEVPHFGRANPIGKNATLAALSRDSVDHEDSPRCGYRQRSVPCHGGKRMRDFPIRIEDVLTG